MKKTLKQFYIDIFEWVADGTPIHPVFSRTSGLCKNAVDYDETGEVYEALLKSFEDAGLDKGYPFHPSPFKYWDEWENGTIWHNPDRIEWVKSHSGDE